MNYAERFWLALAGMLPYKLVYWCAILVAVRATTGEHSSTEASGLKLMEALQIWEINHGRPVANKKPRKQQACKCNTTNMQARVYVRTSEILSVRDHAIQLWHAALRKNRKDFK